jgi:hypothetical protein
MKLPIFSIRPLLPLILLCIASCGGNENKSTSETTTKDSTSTTTTNETPTNTSTSSSSAIVTTPQSMMVVRHKVTDFNKWLMSFEAHDSMKMASGIHNYVIGRGVKDSNIILVATKVDDLDKAKAFGKSPDLKMAMQKSGVVGAPMVNYTTMVYQDTGTINTDLRSRTTFTVKDWDKWLKGFDSSRQIRKDNGITDRAIGHDAGDNHKVTVVVALMDTAKAMAFWKSDQLKKLQAAGGVTSTPERFIYRVVKKY